MTTGSDDDESVDDREWQFSIEELPDANDDDSVDRGSNIAGSLETREPLEPGDIDPENAFFVALGVLIVVGLLVGAMLGF